MVVTRRVLVGSIPDTAPVTHGSQINSGNTGPYGAVVDAPFSGTISMSQAWLDAHNAGSNVITGYRFANTGFNFGAACASLPLGSDGHRTLTIENFEAYGAGWANGSVWFNTALSGNPVPAEFRLRVRYGLFDGLGQVTQEIAETVFQGGQFDVSRCEVKNLCGMTRNYGDDWSALENYVHSLAGLPDEGAHTACITTLHGSNILVARNKAFTINEDGVENDNIGATGAIVSLARQDEGQGSSSDNVQFLDNALQGGSYAMYAGGTGIYELTNFTARGNIFYRDFRRTSGQFGPETGFNNTGDESMNVWDNNTWGPFGPNNVGGDPIEGALVGSDG